MLAYQKNIIFHIILCPLQVVVSNLINCFSKKRNQIIHLIPIIHNYSDNLPYYLERLIVIIIDAKDRILGRKSLLSYYTLFHEMN